EGLLVELDRAGGVLQRQKRRHGVVPLGHRLHGHGILLSGYPTSDRHGFPESSPPDAAAPAMLSRQLPTLWASACGGISRCGEKRRLGKRRALASNLRTHRPDRLEGRRNSHV